MSLADIKSGHTGFYIWRIEKFQTVLLPQEAYGKFYNGDAYIVYCCTKYGEQGGVNMKAAPHKGDRIEQHIHFWLGQNASTDEVTTAAYKTVELDDLLQGHPVQHREVQGSESKRFLSYFKESIRIMQGGVSTGLSHVRGGKKTTKLYIVKGKRAPVIRELSEISWGMFNSGDVFILDAVSKVFLWNGKASNKYERIQAAKFATKLRNEVAASVVVTVEDGQEQLLDDEELELFDHYLPLSKRQVAGESSDNDEEADALTRKDIKLYVCSDDGGTLEIKYLKTGPLTQSDLNSKDSFIIDNGRFGVWAWIGKRASQAERAEALRNAQGFLAKKGYVFSIPITRVVDGGEPLEFKSLFRSWTDKYQTSPSKLNRKQSFRTVQTPFDVKWMHENPVVAAETGMVDDGTGVKDVYRVDHFDLRPVPEEDHGIFYSGDCYLVLYAYYASEDRGQESYIIYFWQGNHSSQDERATAALKAVEFDNKMGGSAVQVRVSQGKEPDHFLALFEGHLRIYQGGLSSTFDERSGKAAPENGFGRTSNGGSGQGQHQEVLLMQIHGKTPLSTVAVQVPLSASSLNSHDCFVLMTPMESVVWMGRGSTGDEREVAKRVAQDAPIMTIVYEGQEKDHFWKLLGGKREPHFEDKVSPARAGSRITPVRLFHASNASGVFRVEEIVGFAQVDLVPEDVMILDTGSVVFVWIGNESLEEERRQASEVAIRYLESDPMGRDLDVPVMTVKQGYEPPTFTGHFGAWDPHLWSLSFMNNH